MPLSETEIKTRLGLVLQGVLAEAIRQSGYTAVEDYQYDPTCEKPDFLIPNAQNPKYMIEVHRTEARNSFQMKTLRAFTAVTEAKAHYGNSIVSVNVLFGDPDRELPASNVQALCGVFDLNMFPRKDASDRAAIARLEAAAATMAADEDCTRTSEAAKDVIAAHPKGVRTLAHLVKDKLTSAKARPELFPMWRLERERVSMLRPSPKAGAPTYYKRGLLGSLFLSDADFLELLTKLDPNKCSVGLQRQLVATGLAEVSEEMDGDRYSLDPQFMQFLTERHAPGLCELCRVDLAQTKDLYWFFEDIRDRNRRDRMARLFLAEARAGMTKLASVLLVSLKEGNALGVEHSRCWIADLMPLAVGKSHNYFNRTIYTHKDYDVPLGNPYNNMAIRAPRLRCDSTVLVKLARLACDAFYDVVAAGGIAPALLSEADLSARLLEFRIGAAIKLRKLDPLLLVVADIASTYGVQAQVETIPSAISDLADEGGVGAFRIPILRELESGRKVLMNAVAVHDMHGDDKSKEWGARRLATLYRYNDGKFRRSEFDDGLFVVDGEWEDKDVARLHRCGWNYICRLGNLEPMLKQIFGLKGKANKVKGAKKPHPLLGLETDEESA
jgi:hypothetical protein